MSDDSSKRQPDQQLLSKCARLVIERNAAAASGDSSKLALSENLIKSTGCDQFDDGTLNTAVRAELARRENLRSFAGMWAEARRTTTPEHLRPLPTRLLQQEVTKLEGPEFDRAVQEEEDKPRAKDKLKAGELIEEEATGATGGDGESEKGGRGEGVITPPFVLDNNEVVAAFRGQGEAIPLARFHRFIFAAGIDWTSNALDPAKSYIMACFSELAYLHLTEHELAKRDRYKLFRPSRALEELTARGIRIDVAAALREIADIGIQIFETRRFVYVVIRVGGIVVVAVRGTASASDLLLDFNALKNPAVHGFYHRGFHDEAVAARRLIQDAVGTAHKVYFTGHSLGAAVAAILTQIWETRSAVMTPYLFAPPRFGTRAAAARLPRFAYTRRRDAIPHLPPKFLGFSDEGAISTVLPGVEAAEVGLFKLWQIIANAHWMEGHRRLLGEAVGEHYPEHIYVDLLIWKLKELQKRR